MLRTKSDTAGITKLKSALGGIKAAIGGIGVAAGFALLVRNIEEAEKATAQLDAAFKNTGRTSGVTRRELDELATQIQKTTTVSDDLVKEAESILLTFDRVRGQAFGRTIQVAADLSARLGTDLKSAIRQVGIALQDPERGLTGLSRSGIAFNQEQKKLIKGFLDTNQAAKAQNLILTELERRFGGSAAAARNTLGGAITVLKNAFGDLFEGTRAATGGLTEGINKLADSLADPGIKKGIDGLVAGFGALASVLAKIASVAGPVIGFIGQAIEQAGDLGNIIDNKLFGRQLDESAFARFYGVGPRGTGPGRRYSRGSGIEDRPAAVTALEEIKVTVRKIVDQNADALRDLEEETRTSTERISADYSRLKAALQTLLDEGKITKETFNQRIGAFQDDILPEFDLNEIKAKYITLKKETSELGEFMKGVWQQVGRSIQSNLSDALYEWRISWKSFIDVARRALADITAAIITSGIKKALQSQLSSSNSSGSSGFLRALGSLFGLAGGGRFDGLRMVGEDGPEVVGGSGRVWNSRQLAFAGAGAAKINYAPNFNLVIQSSGDKESEARLVDYVETRISQSQKEFVRVLARSGVEVRGG